MTGREIVEKVKLLNLEPGTYLVFGSGPLAAAGIREAGDIDLYVTPEVLQRFIDEGWEKMFKGPRDEPYVKDMYEAHANWDFSPYAPSLGDLLKSAWSVDGVDFVSLEEVRKWKLASGGAKNLADVEMIDGYLASQLKGGN